MKSGAAHLPDDPVLLKALILQLQEENALLRHKLFSPKSERSPEDADSPQLAMFNEAEELIEESATTPSEAEAEAEAEEVVAPVKRRGKRKPLPANLPRVEIVHELPEHELTCECGCRKQVIDEETSEQLEIIPMQVRVICHIRKTYACKACEAAPVTADKPAQLLEKSLASPSVLAMLLTTKYADGIPLYRFEKMLSRHGVDIPRQTLARWVIQSGEQLQPLLNLMRDKLLDYPVLHCDETRLQVLHEPGRDPTAQSWMWVQSGGPPDKPVILFDYTASRAQEVPLRLLDGYRGYLMTDDYAGYNAVAAQEGIERLACWAHARRKFVEAQKVQPKGKTGRADMALNLINKLYGIERDLKEAVFPRTSVQLCIVHMVKHSLNYVSWKRRAEVAADLKRIYQSSTADEAELRLGEFEAKWDDDYLPIGQSWRCNWARITPFFDFPPEIRKVIYTTNAIESVNMGLRKITKNRGSFPSDEALLKLYLLGAAQHQQEMDDADP